MEQSDPPAYDRAVDQPVDASILLPCYNEALAIVQVISDVRDAMLAYRGTWEIIVIDDASTDGTAELAERESVRLIRRSTRGGSGAARKTGIEQARGKFVGMLDVDGTYPAERLPDLLKYLPKFDQVTGARASERGRHGILRGPVKWMIRKLAELLSGHKIPDLNSGMKVFKRDLMLKYLWAIPDGFSCVSSMTLAFLCNGRSIKFVPIEYRPRIGQSKFHPVFDTLRYLITVVRLTKVISWSK